MSSQIVFTLFYFCFLKLDILFLTHAGLVDQLSLEIFVWFERMSSNEFLAFTSALQILQNRQRIKSAY